MNGIRIYRIANFLYLKKVPFLPKLLDDLLYYFHNCIVPHTAKIGKRTYLAYNGMAVVVHRNAEIGDNCIIGTCVTIGGRSKKANVPKIGNNVYIATGAKVLGDVKIGDNVIIGANAVVINDIPSNSVVVGMPGKVIKKINDISELI